MAKRKFRIEYHPEAIREIRDSIRWYRDRNEGVADELRSLVESAESLIERSPETCAPYLNDTRGLGIGQSGRPSHFWTADVLAALPVARTTHRHQVQPIPTMAAPDRQAAAEGAESCQSSHPALDLPHDHPHGLPRRNEPGFFIVKKLQAGFVEMSVFRGS